ncbi:hypothetical protein N0Y54_33515 [Nostoc punctiforme UO1]|uniref:hypothetical protein n=1 Tax=Nostoc punctiforme TaxID=272131 RepID=UPI0030B65BC5
MFSDVEFRLRSRVKADSPEAMLFKYLNSRNTLYPAKDMVIIAISSYWLPLAYQAQEQPVDLEPHIRACLYRLQLHSSYLMGLLGEIPSQAATMIAVDRNSLSSLSLPSNIPATEPSKIPPTELSKITATEPSKIPATEQRQLKVDWLNPFSTLSK